jgi:tRNA-binding EMAP/Myf-like protein
MHVPCSVASAIFGAVLVVHTGATVGRVLHVNDHPNGQKIWLARVDLGDGSSPVQIVFGGQYKVRPGELVPVARPGLRAVLLDRKAGPRTRKMRRRNYRGESSHGMFCSLDELGWFVGGPDEVVILQGLKPGFALDGIPPHRRALHVRRPTCLLEFETANTVTMDVISDPAPAVSSQDSYVGDPSSQAAIAAPFVARAANPTSTLRSESHEVDRLVARR